MDGNTINYCPIDTSERYVHDVITKLKFVSKLQKNEKIDLRTFTIVPVDYWTSRFYRALFARDESRDATREFIRGLIDSALTLARMYLEKESSEHFEMGLLLLTTVEETSPGIENLKSTYEDDRMFVSSMETIVERYRAKITNYRQLYTDSNNLGNDKGPPTY